MSNIELVHRFVNAIERGDRDALDRILAPGFHYNDQNAARPLDREEFLAFCEGLAKGIPDLRLHVANLRAGNPVRGMRQITGTHTGPLDMPPFTDVPVHATQTDIRLQPEEVSWTIREGRIVSHEVRAKVGGGPSGILAQVGAPIAVH